MRVPRKTSLERIVARVAKQKVPLPAGPLSAGPSGPVDFGEVSVLPTGAVVGDRCSFKVTTAIYWDLVYTGAATYPWSKIGGPALRAMDEAGPRETNSTTFQTTGSPSVTTPLAMEARARYGAKYGQLNETAAALTLIAGLFVNAVEKDVAAMVGQTQFDTAPMDVGSAPFTVEKGKAVATRYKTSGKKGIFVQLFVELDPIRVG